MKLLMPAYAIMDFGVVYQQLHPAPLTEYIDYDREAI